MYKCYGVTMLQPKIAFLFLVRNNLHQIRLWTDYFNGNEERYSLYVHAKERNQITQSLLLDHLLPESWCTETNYGHISLVEATLQLLKYALQDTNNVKFILVSESHIPITSFQDMFTRLLIDDKSYFPTTENNASISSSPTLIDTDLRYILQHAEQASSLMSYYFLRHHQWCVWNRTMAMHFVCRRRTQWSILLRDEFAPDECYFLTRAKLELTDEQFHSQIDITQQPTYVDWDRKQGTHPFTFPYISLSLVESLNNRFLFLRKVSENSVIDADLLTIYRPNADMTRVMLPQSIEDD